MLALEFSGLNSCFQGLKFVWWCGKERDRFWNEGNGYILCLLGDLNGWIGDMKRAGINGAFGVSGENDRRVVEFYAEI